MCILNTQFSKIKALVFVSCELELPPLKTARQTEDIANTQ